MSQPDRRRRTADADALCVGAMDTALAGADHTGLALVAVGGYGRSELAPFSDLDVVLVHADEAVESLVSQVARSVWYPLWDAGPTIDHSVRALSEAADTARADPRVALGLLDARHVAGDPDVTRRLRTELLAHWRRDAPAQLPGLHALVTTRSERQGELAHASVPDLKESVGGLRDATVLKALVATWLVDVSHADLEPSRLELLDVRDQLHELAGRATDRVVPEVWPELAERLGLRDAEAAQRQVREIGRRITHLSRVTWHRVDAVLARPVGVRRRVPDLERVDTGVAVSGAEVVLDRGAKPAADPLLLLRAAAEAAERELILAPATAARLAREGARIPEPWGTEARNLFVRLLASGPGLLPVWETLDQTGALERVLPEWGLVRLLPHASVVHRFTVDRHLVETCVEAAKLIRSVSRADVLMVAALLHDLGKGQQIDHSVAGEPLADETAARLGFDDHERDLVRRLVRWHLLLPELATTRDLDDPVTVATVLERVGDVETLDLLVALTEADARATSSKAWTSWRSGLVRALAERVRRAASGESSQGTAPGWEPPARVEVPAAVLADPRRVDVRRSVDDAHRDGTTVTVVSGDRIGLMADVAATFMAQRCWVRSARAWSQDEIGVSLWEIDDPDFDVAVWRDRFEAISHGRLDPMTRLRLHRGDRLDPSVQIRYDASHHATVLEVRVDDRAGVVFLVCRALAQLDLFVRSAHVATLGPQAVDVFYVQEPGAGVLSDPRAAEAVHAVRRTMLDAATLGAGRDPAATPAPPGAGAAP